MRTVIILILSVLPFSILEKDIHLEREQLIVFLQETNSEVQSAFEKDVLPELKLLANNEGMDFIVEMIKESAPRAITYTPCVTFRNNEGESFFMGRWNQADKFKNFIRGGRVMHQNRKETFKRDEWVWNLGRLKIYAPIKITELQGAIPKNWNENNFLQQAYEGIEKGTARFNKIENFNVNNIIMKSFHLAFYPYRDKKGKYSITAEIYSQHNCVTPIYTHFENPIQHKDLKKAFEKMAAILEEQIVYQMKNPENGDGFDYVPAETKSVSWNSFGKRGSDNNINTQTGNAFQFKNEWSVKGAFTENTPMIFFKFKGPLGGYMGEVKKMEGRLNLNGEKNMNQAEGQFSIPINSITMGDKSLDEAIHTIILEGEKYPKATFQFKKIIQANGNLSQGEKSNIEVEGSMEMKGKKIPVVASGSIYPMVKNGNSFLHAKMKFEIDKSDFNVEKGPDGPEDLKEKMEFYMNFLME